MELSLKNLSKSFGNVAAVCNVSLDIRRGELFYLLGPSGCGKTTLLRMIAGFVAPDSGHVLLGGKDITSIPARHRDSAMVFQNFALWPHMTVEDNIGFGLAVRKVSKAERRVRVSEALECVRLSGFEARRPHQLSGGQQQRVALARALVVTPGVLLLDEPLSGLDARLRVEMRGELRQICNERQQTTVCVTHDQKEALAVADRIAIMEAGIVIQSGSPREIYEKPRTSAIASFLGECNILPGTAAQSANGQVAYETPVGRIVTRSEGPVSEAKSVQLSIRPENIFLRPDEAMDENYLRGRVVRQTYQGDCVHIDIAIADQILKVTALPGAVPRHCDSEDSITCFVDPDKVTVMKE